MQGRVPFGSAWAPGQAGQGGGGDEDGPTTGLISKSFPVMSK